MDSNQYQLPDESNDAFSLTLPNDPFGLSEPFQDDSFTHLSAALTTAQTESFHHEIAWGTSPTLDSLSNNSTAVSSPSTPGTPIPCPKLGNRFSREVIRTLKNWFVVHQNHPYPKEDDMILLQQRTGLNQAQLANWFANARRRGKAQTVRQALSHAQSTLTSPIDVIPRPGTPAVQKDSRIKNPLQRWVDSPPEHEPADVGDIARAMASNSREAPYPSAMEGFDYARNDPWRSPFASASSAGTSHSSEFSSHLSSGSQSSFRLRRPARRRRASRRRRIDTDLVTDPYEPYQCTFCTESFRTKHDWQRHEKSLHLPLEEWVCAPHGPLALKMDSTELCCVFCGEVTPVDTHIEAHHYSSCQNRSLKERTFHRKDHLVQHLRLVHDAKFEGWSMKRWMIPMPNIKSRCGFCTLEMTTWLERTDHLADHFKAGATMAEWKGDWGFDTEIVAQVENAVPPYLIDYERNTLVPTRASDPPWGSPPNAYELVKAETEFFIQNYVDRHGKLPTNDAIQLEACRVIFAAEARRDADILGMPVIHSESWLRDLVMSSADLTQQAKFGPIRTSIESRHSQLKINGKDHLFEQCPLESQLRGFVLEQQLLGLSLGDGHLQTQMCEIVRNMEKVSTTPSDIFANWLVKGIYSASGWLPSFKHRAGIPHSTEASGSSTGTESHQVMHKWGQTFFPNTNTATTNDFSALSDIPTAELPSEISVFNMYVPPKGLLPDDFNFFRIFESDITRWVAATMSPKNPNCHVPSDEEIQHQARWIMYGGDDAFDQTPADFPEWLWRFKRETGICNGIDAINPAELTRHHQ